MPSIALVTRKINVQIWEPVESKNYFAWHETPHLWQNGCMHIVCDIDQIIYLFDSTME